MSNLRNLQGIVEKVFEQLTKAVAKEAVEVIIIDNAKKTQEMCTRKKKVDC